VLKTSLMKDCEFRYSRSFFSNSTDSYMRFNVCYVFGHSNHPCDFHKKYQLMATSMIKPPSA